MEDSLISFETAKLAKEKGFDWNKDVWNWYDLTGSPMQIAHKHHIPAPAQYLLQKWLREIHGIHIEVLLEEDNPWTNFYCRIMKLGKYFSLSHDGIYRIGGFA